MSFSFLLILLSLFSFQGTMLDAGLWILDTGYLFPYSLHPFEFLKLKVQYLNFCLNTEVWVLTSFIHF